ncbi:MAG: winged helix-turn-helix domain-containing protein [Archaeoglobales archaeon]|nr:winged helix-turn-helix domain-containing protein [Archaeoglobales archaeon]
MLELLASTRLQILMKLRERPYTISELSKALGFSKTTASYHLEKLETNGLVERIERGKWVYYKLTDRGLKNMRVKLTASIGFLITSIASTVLIIAKSIQKFQVTPTAPQIAKEIRPTAIPAPADYDLLQIVALLILALISFLLFLLFRR